MWHSKVTVRVKHCETQEITVPYILSVNTTGHKLSVIVLSANTYLCEDTHKYSGVSSMWVLQKLALSACHVTNYIETQGPEGKDMFAFKTDCRSVRLCLNDSPSKHPRCM